MRDNKVEIDTGRPRIIALANNTEINDTFDKVIQGHRSTLAGIASAAHLKYASMAWAYVDNGAGFQMDINAQILTPYTDLSSKHEDAGHTSIHRMM